MIVFGENKRTVSDKLYEALDDKACDMSEVCSMEAFAKHFGEVLDDYVLVPRAYIIEN